MKTVYIDLTRAHQRQESSRKAKEIRTKKTIVREMHKNDARQTKTDMPIDWTGVIVSGRRSSIMKLAKREMELVRGNENAPSLNFG